MMTAPTPIKPRIRKRHGIWQVDIKPLPFSVLFPKTAAERSQARLVEVAATWCRMRNVFGVSPRRADDRRIGS